MTWKLTLEYDGSKFRGWQEQRNARTVQGDLRTAAEELLRQPVELQGAGRTDAGVHALGQVAHLRVPRPVPIKPERLVLGLNERLPAEIAVLQAENAPPRFHARHDAVSRAYLYQIATGKSAFTKKYAWWIKQELDLEAMRAGARALVGRHDFRLFRATDPARPDESPIVVVTAAELLDPAALAADPAPTSTALPAGFARPGTLLFRIVASHFVWRMVRRVTGTLVQLGLGQITQQDLLALLAAESHLPVAEWTAPAAGLFLERVDYPAAVSGSDARRNSARGARAATPRRQERPRG